MAIRTCHRRPARENCWPVARSLADAELLAILLRTGIVGKGVLQMAQRAADDRPCWTASGKVMADLAACRAAARQHQRPGTHQGLGPAKCAELVAVLELARRALAQQLREREVFGPCRQALPAAARPPRGMRCLPCCFSMRKTACWAWKSCFAARSRKPACTRARWCCAPCTTRPPVVLAHNHPSGSVQPSRADEAQTQTLKTTLALVDVRVLDHVIVAPGQALSMAEEGCCDAPAAPFTALAATLAAALVLGAARRPDSPLQEIRMPRIRLLAQVHRRRHRFWVPRGAVSRALTTTRNPASSGSSATTALPMHLCASPPRRWRPLYQ